MFIVNVFLIYLFIYILKKYNSILIVTIATIDFSFQVILCYRYDLVDIARNSLQDISTKFYTEIIAAYMERNKYRIEYVIQ